MSFSGFYKRYTGMEVCAAELFVLVGISRVWVYFDTIPSFDIFCLGMANPRTR
jgi:hypothetical protein